MLFVSLELCNLAFGSEGTIVSMPHLVVLESVHDFGSVLVGNAIMHDFILENQGDGVLEIISVKPD